MNVRRDPPLLILPWVVLGLLLWALHYRVDGGEATGPTFVVALVYWIELVAAWFSIVRSRLAGRR